MIKPQVLQFSIIAFLLCTVSSSQLFLDDDAYGLTTFQLLEAIPRFDLTKRLQDEDVCTNAIPGTVTQICTPGNTLCCVPNNTNIAYPQCQTLFGEGFCCVSDGGACYQDTQSDCSATGAVECTHLANGTSEACCPQFTQCPSNFNQSSDGVRCQFQPSSSPSSASSATRSTTTITSSSLTLTSTSTFAFTSSSPTSPQSTTSQTPISNLVTSPSTSSSNGLSVGADAGIGVAAALIILALAGLGFWLYRRGKRRGALAALAAREDSGANLNNHNNFPPSPYHDDAVEGGSGGSHPWQPLGANNHPRGFYGPIRGGKHELAAGDGTHELPVDNVNVHELRELPGGYHAHELNNEVVDVDGR